MSKKSKEMKHCGKKAAKRLNRDKKLMGSQCNDPCHEQGDAVSIDNDLAVLLMELMRPITNGTTALTTQPLNYEGLENRIAKKVSKRVCKKVKRELTRNKFLTRRYFNNVMSGHVNDYHKINYPKFAYSGTQQDEEPETPQACMPNIVIPTPSGNKAVKDLKVGDMIFGPRGKHMVIGPDGYYSDYDPISVRDKANNNLADKEPHTETTDAE